MKKIFTITFVAVSSFIFSCKKETTISNESTAVSSMEVTSALHSGTSTSPLVWQVCMGTTADEYGFAVAKAGDGGYFVAIFKAHLAYADWVVFKPKKKPVYKRRKLKTLPGVYQGNIVWQHFALKKKFFRDITHTD